MSQPTFQFTRAAKEDAAALARVQEQAFASDVAKYGDGPPGWNLPDWQVSAMEKQVYYAIRDGGTIIGGIVARDEGDGHWYLSRIFVRPDYQGRGAASRAMAFIEQAILARRWTLHTPYQSFENQRFYEKRGYRKIGEEHPDDIENVPDDFKLFHYEKTMPVR